MIGRKTEGYHVNDLRKYDHVAEILNRIESKIQRGTHNRKSNLGARVNKLSRNNSHKDMMNRSWHSAWEEKDKQSLISNASKAKLIEQKQRKLASKTNENQQRMSDKHMERLGRFQLGQKHQRQTFQAFQNQVAATH